MNMTLKGSDLRALKPRKAFTAIGKHLQSVGGLSGQATLPAAGRAILMVFHFHHEVFNGGFAQYFTNAAGSDCHFVLKYLQSMGCGKQHDLLLRMVVALEAAGVDPANQN